MKKLQGSLLLLLTTLLWGLAFVAQSTAAESIGPLTFNFTRCLLAAAFLFAVLLIRNSALRITKKRSPVLSRKRLLLGGVLCGITLFSGMYLQQAGIAAYPPDAASSGRAGFLTATYVIMIPVAERVSGKKFRLPVILAVIGCIFGMYLLCMSGGFEGIYLGDILELGCAVGFTSYILVVDRFTDLDGLSLSCVQFVVCGMICSAGMLIFEKPDSGALLQAWLPVVYAGIVSSGIGYTLQILGQKNAEPAVASVIMSLESVFAAVFGWIILGEGLSILEIIGCALVFASVIAAQLPDLIPRKKPLSSDNE